MKVRASLKKRCADCQMVRRGGHLYILCRTKPSHKQKQ